MKSKGLFIVLEGIDGSGTTTQAKRLAQHLRAKKRSVHLTQEPSQGPIGSMLRLVLTHRMSFPRAKQAELLALLFAADRLDHVESEVLPHLRDGSIVISDRYDLSSILYQSASSDDPEMGAWVRSLNSRARRPDITLVLNVPAQVAAERRRLRGGGRELFDDGELQTRLADLYTRAEQAVPGDRLTHIDGAAEEDEVFAAIEAQLAPLLV